MKIEFKKNSPKKGRRRGTTKETTQRRLLRAALVGAAIGLYFGWFFRPVREPSLVVVIGLSLLIATVLFLFKLYKRKESISGLARSFLLNFGQYMIIIALLESRHFVLDWGGRPALMAASLVMGAVVGVWFGWRNKAIS